MLPLILALAVSASAGGIVQGGNPSGNLAGSAVTAASATVSGNGVSCVSAGPLTVDCQNKRIGVNDTTPNAMLDILAVTNPSQWLVSVSSQNDLVEGGIFSILQNGNVGISTGAPAQPLDVNGNALVRGLVLSSTTVPSISCNAGTGLLSTDANNNWGAFTAGSAAANCTVTFSNSGFPNNARCVVVDDTSLVAVRVSAQSKTAFTVAGTTISNDVIQYVCGGN